jgi:predicted permease
MTRLAGVRSLLRSLLGRDRLEDRLRDELLFHIECRTEDLVRAGVPRPEAERRARVEFGAVEGYKERCREALGLRLIDELQQDVCYALRGFRRDRGFTAIAAITLALGIGANAAAFTLIHSVLLRALPYREPDRLVMVYSVGSFGPFSWKDGPLADPDILSLRALKVFSAVASFHTAQVALTGTGDPTRLSRSEVTASLFRILGAAPALGRGFEEQDEGTPVAILSDALWRARVGGDPAVIGRSVTLDGLPHTIVGVMPSRFNFPTGAQLWTPLRLRPGYRDNAWNHAVARLAEGVTEAQAHAAVEVMLRNARADRAPLGDSPQARVIRLHEAMVSDARRLLLTAAGVVGFILLIAGANIANLLLARAASRSQEMAVRISLGAGRRRLIRQLLTESLVLAMMGGLLGLALAAAGVRFARAWVPPLSRPSVMSATAIVPRLDEVRVDGAVVAFTFLVCAGAALAFGLAPALAASRREAPRPDQVRAGHASLAERRTRGALVVAETALVLVLLAGGGLLLKSFWRLQKVDPGFRRDRIVTFEITLPDRIYETPAKRRAVYLRLLDRLSGLEGVAQVSAVNLLPFGSLQWKGDFAVEGRQCEPADLVVGKPAVSGRYFETLEIPLRGGRFFDERDRAGEVPVAIVSESVARSCWPGQDAIGRRLTMDDPKRTRWLTVVGVVGDVHQDSLAAERLPMVYVPLGQEERPFFLGSMSYLMKSESTAPALAARLGEEVRAVDPEVPVDRLESLDRLLSASVAEPRFRTGIVAGFALLALALALVGIYGVISYEVTRRTAEIGVRRALGASPGRILWLVLARTLRLVVVGLALGLLAAAPTTRVLESFLFGVKPLDPLTFLTVSLCLTMAAVLASLAPALRAARVDPAIALRWE